MDSDLTMVTEGGREVKVEGDIFDAIMSEISWQMFRMDYGKHVISVMDEVDDETVMYREGIES